MQTDRPRETNLLDRRLLRLQGPDRPWTIRFTAQLSNPITTPTLDAALRALQTVRPDLSAGLDSHGLCWIENDDLVATGECDPDDPIDLARSGIRVALPGPRRLVLDVNHGFTDGLGGLAILSDLLTCLRGDVDVPARHHVSDTELGQLVGRRPLRLAREFAGLARQLAYRPARWPTSETTNVVQIEIDIERLRAARPPGLGVNDVLVAAVHIGLARHLGTDRVSAAVPVDVRRLIGSPTGLGNAVLNAPTRSITHHRGLAAAARSVHHQLDQETAPERLRSRLGAYVLAARPGVPSTDTRQRRGHWPETAVCSNLGQIDVPGCEWVSFSPPARDLVAIGIATQARTTTVTARARCGAERLADLLAEIIAPIDAAAH